MRALSIILTFHILFLTISPVFPNFFTSFENTECTESGCCSKKGKIDDSCPTNKDCGMSICNPFMICCNCHALTPQINQFSAPFVYTAQKYCCINETFYSNYQTDCWHPPKAA